MTSATPSEGKSTVAAHIAVSNAEQRRRTLLIDADMRRPSIHRLFRIPNSGGLTKVLDGEIQWRDALIQPRPDLELYVLPAGATGRRSADQVGQQLPQLLEEASEEFGLTIVDAPPLLGFPEPLQMAAAADGVIVVTRAAKTDRIAVAAVLGILHDLRANMIGLILNEVRKEMLHSYYYYDAYSKYYGTPKQRNRRGTARNERLPID
jgi:capsular exopolysaccharide synthesis family protein